MWKQLVFVLSAVEMYSGGVFYEVMQQIGETQIWKETFRCVDWYIIFAGSVFRLNARWVVYDFRRQMLVSCQLSFAVQNI